MKQGNDERERYVRKNGGEVGYTAHFNCDYQINWYEFNIKSDILEERREKSRNMDVITMKKTKFSQILKKCIGET